MNSVSDFSLTLDGSAAIIWQPSAGPIYDVVALEIWNRFVEAGSHAFLVEFPRSFGRRSELKEQFARGLSSVTNHHWVTAVSEIQRRHDVEVVEAKFEQESVVVRSLPARRLIDSMASHHELPLLRELSNELANSVYSTLCTDLLRCYHHVPRSWKRAAKHLVMDFYFAADSFERLKTPFPRVVCIPNGRYPHQAGIEYAARLAGCEVKFYEVGGDRGRTFHLAEWKTQSKRFLAEVPPDDDSEALGLKGVEYLARRQTDKTSNVFLNSLDSQIQTGHETELREGFTATYFSSSMDEFVGQIDDWEPPVWPEQWTALDEIVPALRRSGFSPQIRIHPNTLNKRWREFLWIECRSRTFDCEVIPSWSKQNSYTLARESDLVISWGSTIALEAAGLGIKSAVLAPTYFGPHSGVMSLHLDSSGSLNYSGSNNRTNALQFLGLLASHGEHFSTMKKLVGRAIEIESVLNRNVRISERFLLPIELFRRPQVLHRLIRSTLGLRTANFVFSFVVRAARASLY